MHLLDASGIPFMVAGSVASTTYGLARSTQDIDVVIDPPHLAALEALVKSMPSDAYYVDLESARDAWFRRSMFNVVDFASGWKVDLIVRKNRPFSREEFTSSRSDDSPRRVRGGHGPAARTGRTRAKPGGYALG